MATSAITALIQELDAYTPCIFETHKKRLNFLVCRILDTARHHFTNRQVKKIWECLLYSAENHKGIYRQDDVTPYLLHPLEVAVMLIEFGIFDFKLLMAAILHDVAEDSEQGVEASLKEIRSRFGMAVECIVALMTKNPVAQKAAYQELIERHISLIKKWYDPWNLTNEKKELTYYQLMKEEPNLNNRWRVLILKLIDRTHNIMTLGAMSKERQQNKIRETKDEAPEMFTVLEKTINLLYKRRILKKSHYRTLSERIKDRLTYELEKYN